MIRISTLLCATTLFAASFVSKAQYKSPQADLSASKISFSEIKQRTKNVTAPASKVYPKNFESGPEFQTLFAEGGAFDYVFPQSELLDKRDLTTKHFLNDNGTITAVSSAGPVHYMKNGLWNTILNDLYADNSFPNYGYAAKHNSFETYYGTNFESGVKILTEAKEDIKTVQQPRITYLDNQFNEVGVALKLNGQNTKVEKEVITYDNLNQSIAAKMTHNSAGYELDYLLKDLNALNIPSNAEYVSFCEALDIPSGYAASLEKDNQVVIVKNNAGRILLKYKTPRFFEQVNKSEEGDIYGRYFVEVKNGLTYVHLLVPAAWLQSTSRSFPIVIDPVVTVTPNALFAWTYTVEEDAGCDYSTNNDQDDNLRVGYDDGFFDDDYYQCYAKYNISSIPDNSCFINFSYCRWYQYNFTNDASGDDALQFYFQAYDPITTDPVPLGCDQNYTDINNTGTWYRYFDAFGNCGAGNCHYTQFTGWHTFENTDVKTRVQQALPYDFVAFSLDNANQGGHSDPIGPSNDEWIDFYGYSNANRPQLVINYEVPYVAATSITTSPSSTVCAGTTVTLTRFAGTTGTAGNWAWYQGSTFLQYNNSSISVTPAATTTYCVRGENACGNTTCTPVTITVQTLSTAPTSITGTTTICNGGSTTLSVSGGSLGTGAQWYWYSGSCGGTFVGNGSSISVSPTSNTTYFVRAQGTCNTTTCASATVVVNVPSTAPGSVTVTQSTICNGQSTQLTVNGGSLGTAAVWRWYAGGCGSGGAIGTGLSITVSPTTTTTYYVRAEGTCNNTSCASATITVNQLSVAATSISGTNTICNGNSTTLSVVGGALGTSANWQWYTASCGGASAGSGSSIIVSPTSTTTYFVRAEGTCNTTACVQLTVIVNQLSTAPVSISGTTPICLGQSGTLSVQGGSLGTGAAWTWYSGSCGGTLLGSGSSITVTPLTTTNYFVRAQGTCNTTTCASLNVVVRDTSRPATSITGITTICNGNSTTLSVSGGFLGTAANWQWYSSACGGTAVGSGTSITVSPTTTTTYFVRAEGVCNTTLCVQTTVTVNQLSTAPTGISGTTTICEGLSTTLSAVGGTLGTGANYQWFSGSCGGTALGSGNSITVTPATTTDYYLRIEGTCNTTNCVFITVTVNDTSRPATSVSGPPAICIGSNANLSAVGGKLGVGAGWQWYTGSCGGTLLATGSPINVTPSITTTYYLRASGLCNTTICIPYTLIVNPLPNGSLNGSVTLCAGFDTSLTFNFAVGASPFDVVYTDGTNVFTKNGVSSGDTIRVLPASTTTYSISQITDANGCIRSSGFLGSATVTVSPLPSITNVSVNDVLCNGGNTGSISITGSGGTPSYQYSINNGVSFQAGSNFNGLTAGNYNLIIADALNCRSAYGFNPVAVNEPPVLDHVSVPTNASCDNVFDGKITVTATGGVTPYTYSLNGGPSQSGNVFSGLLTGTYTVQVSDFNGCTDTTHVFIDTAYSVAGSIVSQTPVSCFGGVDGTVTLQMTGGVPPYSYSINGLQFFPTPTFTGLASGNYVATLRDSKGCTDFVNVTIVQPGLLQAQIDSVKNIGCNGASTGGIYISVSGGNPTYNFLWSNGATTEDITGIQAGTYNVAITDSKGCSAAVGATLSQPLPLFLNIASFNNLLCNNDSSGAVDITVSGGVPPYAFSWSNGTSAEDITHLNAGTYSVTVTDANGCTATISQTITEPALLTASIAGTNLSCFGAGDGIADLTVTGGTSPFSYTWNTGATSQDLSGLNAGTYQVAVRDLNNCSATATVSLTQPTQLVLSVSSTNILCGGLSTGTIDLTVSGSVGPYSYAWSNGATTEDLSSLAAGTYTVTVTATNLCTATASVTLTQPAALTLVLAGSTNVSCNGGNNGTIDINVFGGSPLYSYNWSNGSSSEDLNALPVGTYSVTVQDANACSASTSVTITQPTSISTSITKTDVTCPGAANGSADLTVSGGVSPYTYLWSNGSTSQDLLGVTGGTYTVIVTDANSCTAANSIVINEGLPLSITGVVTNVLCNGNTTGAIDITVSGGNTPYTYAWSNAATTEDLSGIAAGTYTVTVNDVNFCNASASFVVNQPAGLVLNATTKNVSCFGGANGEVDITVQGGVFPYTFAWSNGVTTEDISGLSGGNYNVTITDANACSISATYVLTEPTAIVSSIVGTNVSCFGAANGATDLTVSGGVAPYSYLWNTFQTVEDLSNISGGVYFVIITDANGCTKHDSITITEAPALALSTSVTNVLCNGLSTGAVDLTVSGGAPAYIYLWSNGATTQDLTAVAAGTYSVTVTDLATCTASTSVTITQPSALVLNATTKSVSCFGGANGEVDITVQGGVFPYGFAWSNGATTEDISGLSGGNYSVTITDANACSITASYLIVEPNAITSSIVATSVSCNGAADGAADLTVSGGNAPYNFLWSNFTGAEDASNLGGGLFYVIITDANGCQHKDSVLINEPAPLSLSTIITNISCYNSNDGAIDLVVTGGTPVYTYAWSNGATTEDLNNLQNGVYVVTVTDNNLCTATTSVTIVNPSVITANFVVQNPLCFGSNDGSIDLIPSGGTPSYTFNWSNGTSNEDVAGLSGGTYIVTITDTKGCTRVDSAHVTEPQPLVTSGFITHVTCNGFGNGFIDITAYGGTLPYNFLWSPGQSTEDIGNLSGGDYYVTVTDANGCNVASLYVVIEPQPLAANVVGTNISCFGGNNGTVSAAPTGGRTPYFYLWNNFSTDSSISNATAGKYTVQLTDSSGCFTYDSITLTQPTEILASGVTTNVICFGASTGAIDLTVSGGTPTYTFAWSNGATTEDLSAIAAGTYSLTITDANACTKTLSFTLTEGTQITANLAALQPVCHGGSTGSLTAIANGGSSPYSFNWSTGQTSIAISGLAAGIYSITITDAKSCTATASETLIDPAAITVTTNAQGSKCFNTATGYVAVSVSGGKAPFTYLLNGVLQDTDTFYNLLPGTYLVLATDANGCQGSSSFTVSSPAQISVDLTTTQQVILSYMETPMLATSTSSSPIVNHIWEPAGIFNFNGCADPANCSNPLAAPLTTTTIMVTVMNADSCFATDTLTIFVKNELSQFIPTAFTPNADGLNDRFEFDILGAKNIEVSVYNRWGERIYYNPNQANGITGSNGWDGTKGGTLVPNDTYVYNMTVTYFDGSVLTVEGTVTVMR